MKIFITLVRPMKILRISTKFIIMLSVINLLSSCSNSNLDNKIPHDTVDEVKTKYLINVEGIIINQPKSDILNANDQTLLIEKRLMEFLKSSFQPVGSSGDVKLTIENVNFHKQYDNNKKQRIVLSCSARIRFIINKKNDLKDERLHFTINAWNKKDVNDKMSDDEINNILVEQTDNLMELLRKELDQKLDNILRGYIKKAPLSYN